MRVRRTSGVLPTIAVAALTAACVPVYGDAATDGPRPDAGDVAVEVDNISRWNADVFAFRSGVKMRLGEVVGFGSERFEVPRDLAPNGRVQLLFVPEGPVSALLSERVSVPTGSAVRWTLKNNFDLSSWNIVAR